MFSDLDKKNYTTKAMEQKTYISQKIGHFDPFLGEELVYLK